MDFQQLYNAKKIAAARFLRHVPSVVAVGIGHKEINDTDTGVPCVRIYVTRSFEPEELSIDSLVPPEILGVLTDVIKLPAIFNPLSAIAVAAFKPNLNPILAGTFDAVVEYGGET